MRFSMRSRYGYESDSDLDEPKAIRSLVSELVSELTTEEFSHPDLEHSVVSLTSLSTSWTIEVSLSGQISLAMSEPPYESRGYLYGLSIENAVDLLVTLAIGNLDLVFTQDWRPREDVVPANAPPLYLYASHPDWRDLHRAASLGDTDWLRRAIESTPIDTLTAHGETALHLAAMAGELSSCKRLVEAGANVNARTGSDESVFDCAKYCEFPDSTEEVSAYLRSI